jgi:uncharacterized coiled-coil DUF342 family protein
MDQRIQDTIDAVTELEGKVDSNTAKIDEAIVTFTELKAKLDEVVAQLEALEDLDQLPAVTEKVKELSTEIGASTDALAAKEEEVDITPDP